MGEEIIEFRCKTTKDTVTVFGAGKFGEEKLALNKAQAGLLLMKLWEFIDCNLTSRFTEDDMKAAILFGVRMQALNTDPEKRKQLAEDFIQSFKENK